ncbi:MAG: hypothetical protein K5657_00560 [Desulfovibrio sp.]|nr:hypothetical protein [Desulfovibrio sp.]
MKFRMIAALALVVLSALPAYADGARDVLRGFGNVEGTLLKKVTFVDGKGVNDILLTHTGMYPGRAMDSDETSNSDLYAYGYVTDGGVPRPVWQMHDLVKDCEASAEAEFSPDSPVITDLDENGLSEVWLTYYVGCRGDVSPIGMKILMYEGGRKYALRGETFVHADGMDMGGRYKADPSFATANERFRLFADQLWEKNKRQ